MGGDEGEMKRAYAHKDRAAILWCENASRLTETDWSYLKIPEKEFDSLNPFYFSDLTLALF